MEAVPGRATSPAAREWPVLMLEGRGAECFKAQRIADSAGTGVSNHNVECDDQAVSAVSVQCDVRSKALLHCVLPLSGVLLHCHSALLTLKFLTFFLLLICAAQLCADSAAMYPLGKHLCNDVTTGCDAELASFQRWL